MIIKIDCEISLQEMYDILTDAFENDTIDYWANTISYIRDKDGHVIEWKILEYDAPDGEEHKHTISINTMIKGIKRIFRPDFVISPEIKQWIIVKEMDVTCWDCIIQAGLFGELVYGQEE